MTPELLAELRALCDAATPGPWKALLRSRGMTGIHSEHPDFQCKIYHEAFDSVCLTETHDRQKRDAAFIAAARTAVPALLAEVERLTHDLRNAEQAAQGLRTLAERRGAQLEEARAQLAAIARSLHEEFE